MKNTLLILVILLFTNCTSIKKTNSTTKKTEIPNNAVRIANEELSYEIIILDIGFDSYLASTSKSMSYYSEHFLEQKNRNYVTIWNQRAQNLLKYNPNIYENVIDYDINTHYGLEVNYKLYHYFKFVEHKYHEKF